MFHQEKFAHYCGSLPEEHLKQMMYSLMSHVDMKKVDLPARSIKLAQAFDKLNEEEKLAFKAILQSNSMKKDVESPQGS